MNKVTIIASILAGLSTAGVASADIFSGIDGVNVYQRWYNDHPDSALTITNSGLSSVHIQESNFASSVGYTNRHVAFLSSGGVAHQFSTAQSFRFECDVICNSTLPAGAGNEFGIVNGTAPGLATATPSAGANIGDFHLRVPDGEIAAFGGTNPYFANHDPNSFASALPWPAINTGTTYHMTLIYETSIYGSTYNFGVNNVFTGQLPGAPFLDGGYIGIFEQGPNQYPVSPGSIVDVQFGNLSIQIPTPATAALLGMGGLVTLRRRRR